MKKELSSGFQAGIVVIGICVVYLIIDVICGVFNLLITFPVLYLATCLWGVISPEVIAEENTGYNAAALFWFHFLPVYVYTHARQGDALGFLGAIFGSVFGAFLAYIVAAFCSTKGEPAKTPQIDYDSSGWGYDPPVGTITVKGSGVGNIGLHDGLEVVSIDPAPGQEINVYDKD